LFVIWFVWPYSFILSLDKSRYRVWHPYRSAIFSLRRKKKRIFIAAMGSTETRRALIAHRKRRELPPAAHLVRKGILSPALLTATLLTATLLTAALLFTLATLAFLSFAILLLSALLSWVF
jgi:hypothetical protein